LSHKVAVGILGTEAGPHIRELKAALEGLGHRVILADPKKLLAKIPGGLAFLQGGSSLRLEELGGLVVRSLPGGSLEQVTFRLNALHWLESLGVPVINSASVIEKTVDKFYATALLEKAGLPVPRTVVAESYAHAMAAVEELGTVVVKPVFGSLGKGIVRIEDPDTAHRVFRALELGRYVYYVQEYLDSGGGDYRLLVAGGEVLGAMRRRGTGWKSNVACGAAPEAFTPEPELARIALCAAKALGADYAGVDILISKGSPYLLEVNGIPGWAGLQSVVRVDIARTLTEFFLRRMSARGGSISGL
jgi:ribosomal protein S6--L-glutamate ligase/tetrahydromethanopterin:alpha-L-glutamate ligase